MNLADQIKAATSTPAPAEKRKEWRLQNLALGSKAQSEKAVIRYRAVMQGRDWMTQTQIENALGYAATVSTAFLAKLLGLGFVERRNRDGAPTFQRQRGYEWRWTEC